MLKRISLAFAMFLTTIPLLYSQMVYKIKTDSLKVTNDSCSAEFILENSTRSVKGFLFNWGNGRTEFRQGLLWINDSVYVIGSDTLKLNTLSANAWRIGGNAGTNPVNHFLGTTDNTRLVFRTNNTENARLLTNGNLLLGTTTDNGYKLDVNGSLNIAADARVNGITIGKGTGNQSHNTVFGSGVLAANSTGNYNTIQGASGLAANTTGSYNSSVGYNSLLANTTGSNNSVLGYSALSGNLTGANNVAIGTTAGSNLTTGSGNIFIGNNVQPNISNTGSNQLNLGGWIYGNDGKIGIMKPSPAYRLDILDSRTGLTAEHRILNVSNSGSSLNGTFNSYNIYSVSNATGTLNANVGGYFAGTGSTINIGLIATASGGTSNYAAQFIGAPGSPILRLDQTSNTAHSYILFNLPSVGLWSVGAKGTSGDFAFNNSGSFTSGDWIKIANSNGNVGIGNVTTPTARLHLVAGNSAATLAPLKFTQGVNLTTPENGAVEYDAVNLMLTTGGVRHTLAKTLTATSTLNFGNTAAQTHADLTITVTGAADGDAVSLGVPNAAINNNSSYSAWVSATNTVTVRFNNYSSGAIDPASSTFRVSVLKY